MSLVLDADGFTLSPQVAAKPRLLGAIRYAGVLAVWFGLLLIRPRLAIGIFRERRADSPLRLRRRPLPSTTCVR